MCHGKKASFFAPLLVTMTWPYQGTPSAPSCESPYFLEIIQSHNYVYLSGVRKNLWQGRERSLFQCTAAV